MESTTWRAVFCTIIEINTLLGMVLMSSSNNYNKNKEKQNINDKNMDDFKIY